MDIELIEIRDYLATLPLFKDLNTDQLDSLPRRIAVRYLRRGSPFPPADAQVPALYILRSGALELRDNQGTLLEKLGEGDWSAELCEQQLTTHQFSGVMVEDSLLYVLPCSQLTELRQSNPQFDSRFDASLTARLKSALNDQRQTLQKGVADLTLMVGGLLQRKPVTVPAQTSIREAARIMAEADISSLLITNAQGLAGIITDRDLRRRCVAVGRDVNEPVSTIMTRDVVTIPPTMLLAEAVMHMTQLNVHHLPVVQEHKPIGMISSSDIARVQSVNSAYFAMDVSRAQSISELVQISARLPDLQVQLVNSGATAQHIGEAVASVTDHLTQRLIALAEAEFGPAPMAYAWLAGGSQGRREQTSHSDQDNALLLAREPDAAEANYFEQLARFVSDGLHACGFYYCPGEAMATNPKWRQPLNVWQQYYKRWIETPDPKALMFASIFFDLRVVHGDVELYQALQHEILSLAGKNRIFVAYMAANALHHRPPLGFFRTFVLINDGQHDATLDIKHRGVVPITDIARVYSLSSGIPDVNTATRLQQASEIGAMSEDMAESLRDALEFIATLRLQHQVRQITSGKTADNYLPPHVLSGLERTHLKDAFKLIQTMQETLANRYQLGRFS